MLKKEHPVWQACSAEFRKLEHMNEEIGLEHLRKLTSILIEEIAIGLVFASQGSQDEMRRLLALVHAGIDDMAADRMATATKMAAAVINNPPEAWLKAVKRPN